MIGLLDLLEKNNIKLNTNNLKIHLASYDKVVDPLDSFFNGSFKEWQESQRIKNFECDQIISLIDLEPDTWLFAGVYNVKGVKKKGTLYKYTTDLVPGQDDLVGRVIVGHERNARAPYIWYKSKFPLSILEIRREKLTIEDFPGFNSVLIDYAKLKTIIEQKVNSWHTALANAKGVYIITDKSTGMHYVGKASGDCGIWQRWSDYAKNGHGGNENLKQLLDEKGPDHKYNFQYSILEAYTTEPDNILDRESHWMNVLLSRSAGLNKTGLKKKSGKK